VGSTRRHPVRGGSPSRAGWESSPIVDATLHNELPDGLDPPTPRPGRMPLGGVLVHCKAGCGHIGMIVAMLLSLVETPVADILDDYEFAVAR